MYAAYVLILVLGLRKGEVLGLRWDAVDLDGRELVIDHQVQRVRRELLYRMTKTDASLDEYGVAGHGGLFVGNDEGRPRCLATRWPV
jgi:integrase